MGCSQSTPSSTGAAASPQEVAASRAIDEDLSRAKKEDARLSKCLLLGPGESGKSTVVKQLRLCYAQPWDERERAGFREIVFANTLQSAQAVLSAFPSLGVALPPNLAAHAEYLSTLELDDALDPLTSGLRSEVSCALKAFVADEATREVLAQSGRFQLNDSADFFAALGRICEEGYLPSVQDVLRTRVRSTGIVEERFDVGGGRRLLVVDVGGQRSERKKWIHCFENVNILLFVVAISEYDQALFEDERVNRLDESLQLWETIAGSRWFSKSSFVLFLNKRDRLAEKILSGRAPLSSFLPSFTGPDKDVSAAEAFLSQTFKALYRNGERQLYAHLTCATDTASTKVILGAVLQSVLTRALADIGML
ncbi:guanine nucleotide-binding protein subunit alpha [Rhodotorula kratochvilovae]